MGSLKNFQKIVGKPISQPKLEINVELHFFASVEQVMF